MAGASTGHMRCIGKNWMLTMNNPGRLMIYVMNANRWDVEMWDGIESYDNEEKNKCRMQYIWESLECESSVGQLEQGDSGTYHYQIFVHFANKVSGAEIRRRLGNMRSHIEKCLNVKASMDYCRKRYDFSL